MGEEGGTRTKLVQIRQRCGGATPAASPPAVMKITVPKAPWSAVAAATAFFLPICRMNRRRKAVAAATALQGASRIFIVSGAPKAHGRLCGKAKPFHTAGRRSRVKHSQGWVIWTVEFANRPHKNHALEAAHFLSASDGSAKLRTLGPMAIATNCLPPTM